MAFLRQDNGQRSVQGSESLSCHQSVHCALSLQHATGQQMDIGKLDNNKV